MKNVMEDLILPEKVDDLIKLLNKVYPEKSPDLKDDSKTIYFNDTYFRHIFRNFALINKPYY